MISLFFRCYVLALLGSVLLVGAGCVAPGLRVDVTRFQAALPEPQGQNFRIAADPALSDSIEFNHYADLVAERLTQYGYRAVGSDKVADLTVAMAYKVDKGKEYGGRFLCYGSLYDDYYGPYYGPIFFSRRSRPYSRRWIYGWRYHPWGAWGGCGGYDSFYEPRYTIYTSQLDLTINRTSDGKRLFEGRAEAHASNNDLTRLVPALIEAMFSDFPGNSGKKLRIIIMPPPPPPKE